MNEKAYVKGNFRKAVKYKNLIKVEDFNDAVKLNIIAQKSVSVVNNENIWSGALDKIIIKGKDAWTIKSPEAILIHNLLMNNLQSNYLSRCNDRKITIELLLSHLKDSYNFSIHRLDIKSFYESFERKDIIKKLKTDAKLTKKSLDIIESLFNELTTLNTQGLPRGLGISSTLSELMMSSFDNNIKSIKDVLYYARFVDDIIVISTPSLNKKVMTETIKSSGLPHVLEFHNTGDKVFFSQVEKTSTNNDKKTSFDFLGYEFCIERGEERVGRHIEFGRRKVEVSIAPNKVKKIKNRMIRSFTSVLSSTKADGPSIKLLNKRIKFLTKNYLLESSSRTPSVYSGIYHNYSFITKLEELYELDRFLQNLLFGKHSKLNKRIRRSIPFNTRVGIAKHSFLKGYKDREFCRFTFKDFSEIKKVWS